MRRQRCSAIRSPAIPIPMCAWAWSGPRAARLCGCKLPIHPGQDYIPRFGWVDRKTLWIETLTRDHKHRDLYFADAASGQSHRMLEITDDKFVDDNYDVPVGNGTIVLTNWTDGHNHLYLYSYNQNDPLGRRPNWSAN